MPRKPQKLPEGMRYHRGKIQVRYREDGRQKSLTFDTLSEAEAFRADLNRGKASDPRLAKMPFRELAEEWQGTRRNLRVGTIARQDSALNVHLLPKFGRTSIGRVSWEAIESLRDDLLSRGRSPAHVTKVLEVLNQILKLAVKKNLIPSNPMDLVDGPGTESEKEIVFLEPSQLNDLAESIDPRFRAMVLLSGYRGLRFGEASGLRVGRLNLLQSALKVEEILVEVRGALSYGPPKTKESIRTVRLPRFLTEALDAHLKAYRPEDLVFANPDGTPLRRSNFSRRIWKPAIRKADVPEGLTFHGLRHSAVSMLIAESASLVEIGAILGWSKNSIPRMAARYGHLYPSRDQDFADRLDAIYRAANGK